MLKERLKKYYILYINKIGRNRSSSSKMTIDQSNQITKSSSRNGD